MKKFMFIPIHSAYRENNVKNVYIIEGRYMVTTEQHTSTFGPKFVEETTNYVHIYQ